MLFGATALIGATVAVPVQAIPRLDLSGYPAPADDLQRWVIQLPGVLPRDQAPTSSQHPIDWRVQLIVGKTVSQDCNQQRFTGKGMRILPVKGLKGRVLFEVPGPVLMISTRKACLPAEPTRQSFLVIGRRPYVIPYNASFPIVVDVPQGFEVRWRLWKAETMQQNATQL
ncbi:MAG: ecotin family protein [Prochlorococcus sp.]